MISPQLQAKSLLQHSFSAKQSVTSSDFCKQESCKQARQFFLSQQPSPIPSLHPNPVCFTAVQDAPQDALRPTNTLRTFGKAPSLNSSSPSQERRNLSSYSIPKVPGHTLAETHLAGWVESDRSDDGRGQRVGDELLAASVDGGNGVGSACRRGNTASSECTEARGRGLDSWGPDEASERDEGQTGLNNRKVGRVATSSCRRAVQDSIAAKRRCAFAV